MIDQTELKLQFEYDPLTGIFRRVKRRDAYGNLTTCDYIIVGDNGQRGYKRVSINGKRYLLHKLVFLYIDGVYPDVEVDHLNGNTSDNRLLNLRVSGRLSNRLNLKLYSTNTSGFTGVTFRNGRYYVQACKNRKTYSKGSFSRLEDAILARKELNSELGFNENHGRKTESQT